MKQPCALSRYRNLHVIVLALCLIFDPSFGQTTRTGPSASPTKQTIPSAASRSANAPCAGFNPTSPCYSGSTVRNPCYSALAPDQPCSTATAPYPQASTTPTVQAAPRPPSTAKSPVATIHALTIDQATAQIEAKGYSNIAGLRRDRDGNWQCKAERDGSVRNVTLDRNGNLVEN